MNRPALYIALVALLFTLILIFGIGKPRPAHAQALTVSVICSAQTTSNAVGATISIAPCTGAATGDVLILTANQQQNPVQDIKPPTGWSPITQKLATYSGTNNQIAVTVYTHTMVTGDPGSWAFTPTNPGGYSSTILYAVRNVGSIKAKSNQTSSGVTGVQNSVLPQIPLPTNGMSLGFVGVYDGTAASPVLTPVTFDPASGVTLDQTALPAQVGLFSGSSSTLSTWGFKFNVAQTAVTPKGVGVLVSLTPGSTHPTNSVTAWTQPVDLPLPADAFIDSEGMNIHLPQTNTFYGAGSVFVNAFTALGVRHVRDGAGTFSTGTYQCNTARTMGAAGIKFDIISQLQGGSAPVTQSHTCLDPYDELYEGPNETDLSGIANWQGAAVCAQVTLWNTVKAFATPLPVIMNSIDGGQGTAANQESTATSTCGAQVGPMGFSDFANMHDYLNDWNPGTGDQNGTIKSFGFDIYNMDYNRVLAHPQPTYSTEIGWGSDSLSSQYVDPTTQAKYIGRLFLEHYRMGVPRTYLYEFADSQPTQFNTYGIVQPVGSGAPFCGSSCTGYTAKPAYTLLSSLNALLADPGQTNLVTAPFQYSLTVPNEYVHKLLLQKADGTKWLVLWIEQPSYNPGTHLPTAVPAVNVTLTLASTPTTVTQYQYLDAGSYNTTVVTPSTSIVVPVDDHITVLRLTAGTAVNRTITENPPSISESVSKSVSVVSTPAPTPTPPSFTTGNATFLCRQITSGGIAIRTPCRYSTANKGLSESISVAEQSIAHTVATSAPRVNKAVSDVNPAMSESVAKAVQTPAPTPTPGTFCSENNISAIVAGQSWPLSFCPFSINSPFKVNLPSNPAHVIDTANVRALTNTGCGDCITGVPGVLPNSGMDGRPTYIASNSDPLRNVTCTQLCYGFSSGSVQIHVPQPPNGLITEDGGGDHHLAILQQNGELYDFWQFSSGGSNVTGSYAVRVCGNGQGTSCTGPFGVLGYGVPGTPTTDLGALAAGLITANEWNDALANGNRAVKHSLILIGPCSSSGSGSWMYPGTGPWSGNQICPGGSQGVPMGGMVHIRLTDAQIDAIGLNAWFTVIAKTIAHHGMYMSDFGGNCAPPSCGGGWGLGFPSFMGEASIARAYNTTITFNGNWGSWCPGGTCNYGGLWQNSTIINNLEVLDVCYARMNCSDSLPPSEPS